MKTFLVILRTVELDLLVEIIGVSVPGAGALSWGVGLCPGKAPSLPPCKQANRCKNITFPCGR